MVAIAYTDTADVYDIATAPSARPLRAVKAPEVREHRPVGDPLIDATTRLLTVPMRQAYALLWRTGLLVVNG